MTNSPVKILRRGFQRLAMAAQNKKKELVIECLPSFVEDIRVPKCASPIVYEDPFSGLNVWRRYLLFLKLSHRTTKVNRAI